jgi:hypothetical protein
MDGKGVTGWEEMLKSKPDFSEHLSFCKVIIEFADVGPEGEVVK